MPLWEPTPVVRCACRPASRRRRPAPHDRPRVEPRRVAGQREPGHGRADCPPR
jgi:hypothetical protein